MCRKPLIDCKAGWIFVAEVHDQVSPKHLMALMLILNQSLDTSGNSSSDLAERYQNKQKLVTAHPLSTKALDANIRYNTALESISDQGVLLENISGSLFSREIGSY